jgi:hypothetical protein
VWHRRRRRQRRAYNVGIEDAPPRFGIGIHHADERPYGRCVHQVVDAAQCVSGIVDGRSARCLVGDIAFDGDRAWPCVLGRSLDTLTAPGEQRDMSAALRKADTNAAPEPARCANHHCP